MEFNLGRETQKRVCKKKKKRRHSTAHIDYQSTKKQKQHHHRAYSRCVLQTTIQATEEGNPSSIQQFLRTYHQIKYTKGKDLANGFNWVGRGNPTCQNWISSCAILLCAFFLCSGDLIRGKSSTDPCVRFAKNRRDWFVTREDRLNSVRGFAHLGVGGGD